MVIRVPLRGDNCRDSLHIAGRHGLQVRVRDHIEEPLSGRPCLRHRVADGHQRRNHRRFGVRHRVEKCRVIRRSTRRGRSCGGVGYWSDGVSPRLATPNEYEQRRDRRCNQPGARANCHGAPRARAYPQHWHPACPRDQSRDVQHHCWPPDVTRLETTCLTTIRAEYPFRIASEESAPAFSISRSESSSLRSTVADATCEHLDHTTLAASEGIAACGAVTGSFPTANTAASSVDSEWPNCEVGPTCWGPDVDG